MLKIHKFTTLCGKCPEVFINFFKRKEYFHSTIMIEASWYFQSWWSNLCQTCHSTGKIYKARKHILDPCFQAPVNRQYKIVFWEKRAQTFTFDLAFYMGLFLDHCMEGGAETEYSSIFELGRENQNLRLLKHLKVWGRYEIERNC